MKKTNKKVESSVLKTNTSLCIDVRRKNDAIKRRPTYGNPLETIRSNTKKRVTITEKKLVFRNFKPEIITQIDDHVKKDK